jgi:type IV pilus assembly protein PilW
VFHHQWVAFLAMCVRLTPLAAQWPLNFRERGFSIVELLISMLLALITFLSMFQMFDSWDKSKRSTASGGGAMVTGALAMFRLERDLRLAGFGFGNAVELGCTVNGYDATRPDTGLGDYIFNFPLTPLAIVNGLDGAPDQIITFYGSSEAASPTRFFGTTAAGAQPYTSIPNVVPVTSVTMEVGALGGIQQGDLVVIGQTATQCDLEEVTFTGNADRRTFDFNGSPYTFAYTNTPNTQPRYNNPLGVTVAASNGRVYNLGPRPQRHIWQIRNNRTLAYVNDLRWVDTDADGANDFVDVADNIVNLQAEYGLAATVVAGPPQTCTASSTITWTSTDPSPECMRFLWAVRVGLLARSDHFEKTWGVPANAGNAAIAPQWIGGGFTMTNTDGTADSYAASTLAAPSKNPKDWRHYRYRVFDAIIPMKNMMWGARQ